MAAHPDGSGNHRILVKLLRLMKNAFLLATFTALTLSLTGCGEIESHQSYPRAVVEVTRNGRPVGGHPVGVAIRSHRDKPFTVPQEVVTDREGVAKADFPTTWANGTFTFPRVGAVPREAPKPQYLVYVGKQEFRVTPKTPGTTYSWNGERWETKTMVALP